eukprot:Phypoly_transcript_14930.p1 GENE.Phypoly_transcript_14930~~Phypoly_transcript_14930.p1  ORF type:complete len:186 (+),score=19.00 Phypoly_transcript_14930:276-833(+)
MSQSTGTSHTIDDETHIKWMREALAEANLALTQQEVPVGCVFVYQGEVIGRGSNKTNLKRDATRHAEFEAIDMILQDSDGRYTPDIFQHCTLYVTVEPCIMCAAALAILNIKTVVFGCGNERFGGCGSVLDVRNHCNFVVGEELPPPYTCITGILKQECIDALQRFYEQENPNAPTPLKKTSIVS